MSKSYLFIGGSMNGLQFAIYDTPPPEYRVAIAPPINFDLSPDLNSIVPHIREVYIFDKESQSYWYNRIEEIA